MSAPDPILLVGIEWSDEDGGGVGIDFQITLHGAADEAEALAWCQARSYSHEEQRTILLDWTVVDEFVDTPFAYSATCRIKPTT